MDNALQNSAGGDILLEIKNLYAQYNTDDAVVHALNGFHLTLHLSLIHISEPTRH